MIIRSDAIKLLLPDLYYSVCFYANVGGGESANAPNAGERDRRREGVGNFHSTKGDLSVTSSVRGSNKILTNTESRNVLQVPKGRSRAFKAVAQGGTTP